MTATVEEQPPRKVAKRNVDEDAPTGWEDYELNVSEALMKAEEPKHLQEIKTGDVAALQGIGPYALRILEDLKVKTVEDLAKFKYFHMARALTTLAETETKGGRLEGSLMNVDQAVIQSYEGKSFKEISKAPVHVLQGVSPEIEGLLGALGAKTVEELASLKYCRWAEAISEAAKYEHLLTDKERHVKAQLKKLS